MSISDIDDMLPSLTVVLEPGRYAQATPDQFGGYDTAREKRRITYDNVLDILETQKTLQSSLAVLAEGIEQPREGIQPSAQQQALAAAQHCSSSMQYIADSIYGMIPPHERPPTAASGAKAEEVFSCPELLETILLAGNICAREKLQAMCVKRNWRDTVKGSVKLRRSLGLSVSLNSFYYTPFDNPSVQCKDMPGRLWLRQSISGAKWDLGRTYVEFNTMTLRIGRHYQRQWSDESIRGSRVQSMRLCNPPINVLEVHRLCMMGCPTRLSKEHSKSVVGFTVGEIDRKLKEWEDKNLQCPRCKRKNGSLEFRGKLSLSPNDPAAKICNADTLRRYECDQQRQEKQEKKRLQRIRDAAMGIFQVDSGGTSDEEVDSGSEVEDFNPGDYFTDSAEENESEANQGSESQQDDDVRSERYGAEGSQDGEDHGPEVLKGGKGEDRRWPAGGPPRRVFDCGIWNS